jgi:hypothetical protein
MEGGGLGVMTEWPNWQIVSYALYLLGGATVRQHTEDITLKCFELAPDAFSWTNYPEYPDKDIVRVALTDAKKTRNGALVEGRAGQRRGQYQVSGRQPAVDGWTLTDDGIQWVEANQDRLRALVGGIEPKAHRQRVLQFLGRVKRHRVFQQYANNPKTFAPGIGELADLLRCRVDADPGVWKARFEGIRKNAVAAGEAEIVDFVERSTRAYEIKR